MNKNQNQNPEEEILKNEETENLQQETETQTEETNSAENAGEEKEAELSEEEKADRLLRTIKTNICVFRLNLTITANVQ